MDAIQFLLGQHARNHSSKVATWEGTNARGQNQEDSALDGLSEDQIRKVPLPQLNSVAWVLWHIARYEDIVTSMVASSQNVWQSGGWAARLRYDRRDGGTGMTPEDVGDLSARIDIGALREYRWAVGRRTREIIERLRVSQLAEKIQAAAVRTTVKSGYLGPDPDVDRQVASWTARSLGYALSTYAVSHNIGHWGEVTTIKSFL